MLFNRMDFSRMHVRSVTTHQLSCRAGHLNFHSGAKQNSHRDLSMCRRLILEKKDYYFISGLIKDIGNLERTQISR